MGLGSTGGFTPIIEQTFLDLPRIFLLVTVVVASMPLQCSGLDLKKLWNLVPALVGIQGISHCHACQYHKSCLSLLLWPPSNLTPKIQSRNTHSFRIGFRILFHTQRVLQTYSYFVCSCQTVLSRILTPPDQRISAHHSRRDFWHRQVQAVHRLLPWLAQLEHFDTAEPHKVWSTFIWQPLVS